MSRFWSSLTHDLEPYVPGEQPRMAELVKLGVASGRLVAKGYGEEHPVGDNATEAGRAQNRRISMLITQK